MSLPPIMPLPSSANNSPFTPLEFSILAASSKAIIQNLALHTPPCGKPMFVAKYKCHRVHKVQISCSRHMIPKYKFHKVHKVQISCSRHVTPKYKLHKMPVSCGCYVTPTASPPRTLLQYVGNEMEPAYRNKYTPYGPYNLPHMVLCTKKGPDNA